MLTLSATDSLSGVAGTASAVTYTLYGDQVTSGDAFKVLAQGQLPSSAGSIYPATGGTQTLIKAIHLSNTTGSQVSGIKFYVNGTAATNQIVSLTIAANGTAEYNSRSGWRVYDANGILQPTNVSSATPQVISDSIGTPGTSTAASAADHVHQHGSLTSGTDHAVATVSVAGFMAAADKTKLNGLVSGPSGWVDVTQQTANPVLVSNSGSVNNTNLAAIMTAAPSGSVLYFPPGWYTFASTITIPAKVFIFQGSGAGLNGALSAFTWTTNNAGDWITQTAADYYMQFRDLGFIAQLSQTAGAVINVNGNANNHIYNCVFTGLSATQTLFNLINFNGGNGGEESIVYGCDFTNFTGTGVICNSNLSTAVIDSCTFNGGAIAACGVNIIIGGAIQIVNSDIIGCTNNLLINPVTSTVVASVWCTNTYFDNALGSCIKITGAGATVRCKFEECSFTTNGSASPNNAVEVSSTFAYGTVGMGLDFINCNVLNTFATGGTASGTGFNITGAGDFRIMGCNIALWTTGIAVTPANSAGMTRPQIVNNTIGNAGGYGGNTTGVVLNAGSFAYGLVQIDGNVFSGNATNLTDNSSVGTGTAATGQKLIVDNTGFVTPPPANYSATTIPLTTVTNVDSRGGILIPTGTGTRPCSIRITVYATNAATIQTLTATVRYGVNNSNADAAVQTQAFTAGTAVVGSGLFIFDVEIPTSTTLASSLKFFNGNNAATGIAANVSLFSSLATLATISTAANNWLGVYFSSATALAITIRSVKYEVQSQ